MHDHRNPQVLHFVEARRAILKNALWAVDLSFKWVQHKRGSGDCLADGREPDCRAPPRDLNFQFVFFICLALAPAWPPCPTQGSEFVICFSYDLPRFGAGVAPDNIGVARLISERSEFVVCFS